MEKKKTVPTKEENEAKPNCLSKINMVPSNQTTTTCNRTDPRI